MAYRLVDRPVVTGHDPQVNIGKAIREVRGDLTQEAVARAVGTDQGTVSKWENGAIRPSLDDLVALEDLVHVPHGTVLRRAGYVDEVVTVEDALEADGAIPRGAIPAIVAGIRAVRRGRS